MTLAPSPTVCLPSAQLAARPRQLTKCVIQQVTLLSNNLCWKLENKAKTVNYVNTTLPFIFIRVFPVMSSFTHSLATAHDRLFFIYTTCFVQFSVPLHWLRSHANCLLFALLFQHLFGDNASYWVILESWSVAIQAAPPRPCVTSAALTSGCQPSTNIDTSTRENIEFQQNNVPTQILVGLACKLPLTSRDPNIKWIILQSCCGFRKWVFQFPAPI